MAETQAARMPTLADVARAAGVSAAAVSYVLNGRSADSKRVGSQTRERIEAAIAELGYVRNQAARHLRRRRTDRICVVLFELGNPFADKLARDIETAARAQDFTTVVTTSDNPDGWRRIVADIDSGLADALILDVETEGVDDTMLADLLAPLRRSNRPVLLFHSTAKVDGVSAVRHGRIGALQSALVHARDAGHRRFCYVVNGSTETSNVRRDLVRSFASQHDLPEPLILGGAHQRAGAVTVANHVATMSERPSVIFSESDFSAVAMIHAFQQLGLRVPQDIAVIGCGNAEEGQYCNPALTTIGPTQFSLIDETTHLIDRVLGPDTVPPKDYCVPWHLIVRASG